MKLQRKKIKHIVCSQMSTGQKKGWANCHILYHLCFRQRSNYSQGFIEQSNKSSSIKWHTAFLAAGCLSIPSTLSSVSSLAYHVALSTGTDKHARWDWEEKRHHKHSQSRLLSPPHDSHKSPTSVKIEQRLNIKLKLGLRLNNNWTDKKTEKPEGQKGFFSPRSKEWNRLIISKCKINFFSAFISSVLINLSVTIY